MLSEGSDLWGHSGRRAGGARGPLGAVRESISSRGDRHPRWWSPHSLRGQSWGQIPPYRLEEGSPASRDNRSAEGLGGDAPRLQRGRRDRGNVILLGAWVKLRRDLIAIALHGD